MKIMRRLTASFLGLTLALGLLVATGQAAPLLYPGNPTVDPARNAHHVARDTAISITYDEPIDPATVSTQTFAVHAMQTGLLGQAYLVNGGAISLISELPLKPGELVQVSATKGTLGLNDGLGPAMPTVWQFWAKADGGSGMFTDSGQRLGQSNAYDAELGDLDHDGDLDALVLDSGGKMGEVWQNNGLGFFSLIQKLGNSNDGGVSLGDVDGDSDLDVFFANAHGGGHTVWLNDGAGFFSDSGQLLGNSCSNSVALGDLDGDGDLDAFVGNNFSQPNEVWLNDGGAQGGSPGVFKLKCEPLTIDNFSNGATLRYELPLLKGTAPLSSYVIVSNGDSSTQWSVNDGRWRAFVPLAAGENNITLETSGGCIYGFSLLYEPQTNDKFIRLVYPLGADSSGVFDAPMGQPNAMDNAKQRIALTGQILQSLMAEFLVEAGGSRQTFQLLRDTTGNVVVDTPRSNLTVAELWAMNGGQLWSHYAGLFGDLPNRSNVKDVAIIADTHYDANTGKLYAHTALGGGRLALFGGGTLYSFPESIQEIEAHFADASAIESYLFPEYGRRRQYWATLATSMGAILHETGHTFGLSHPPANHEPGEIMWRGFDYLNRAIVTYEPGFGNIDPSGTIMPKWNSQDVAVLSTQPWLQSGISGGGNGGPVLLSTRVPDDPNNFSGVRVTLGDLDGDGDLDAFTNNFSANPVNKVWLNDGTGDFALAQELGAEKKGTGVALGDLDGDGDLDAFITNYFELPDTVWLNNGGAQGGIPGVFSDSGQRLGNSNSTSVSLGDVDGDGDLDAFVTNYPGQSNSVWLNNGGKQGGTPGVFTNSGQHLGKSVSGYAALGDVDNDGDLDAFVSNWMGGHMVWLNDD